MNSREPWHEMLPFREAGFMLMPLTAKNLPRDKGWPGIDYTEFDCQSWLRRGGVGIQLGPRDLVVDVDPRNDGERSFERLSADVGLDIAAGAPTVRTGGGGTHHYLRKPEGLRTRITLKDYPGIDFKRRVGMVVAPGSFHARTAEPYWLESGSPSEVPDAPEALLQLIAEPERPRKVRGESGVITCDELARLLRVIDVRRYGVGRYDRWIALSAAAHDATGGEGFAEWADWCRRDPNYAGVDDDLLEYKWDSFDVGKPDGATYLTLFKAVSRAGHRHLLRDLGARLDFDAEPAPVNFEVP